MSSSDELKLGDRVVLHPQWIINCVELMGEDSVSLEDITMEGTIINPGSDQEDSLVKWDNNVEELVTACNLLVIKEE